eukprot:scaffold16972_cov94-Skeletonema_dohrnii-CCMP3373.AAC.2
MGIEAVVEKQSTQLRRQSRTVQRMLSMSDGAVSLGGWIVMMAAPTNMRLPTFTVAASSGLICLAYAKASEDSPYAFHETTVNNLGAPPADECFYDVTVPALLDMDYVKYAWIPWSKLSNESLAIAPHGAFVYKTTNDTLVYEAISLVPVDSPEADLVFGLSEPFCTAAKTFDEITSGKVNCSSDDEVMNERIRTGLNCWASPMSYQTEEPFINYKKFAWVSADASKCGEYVYELKDGTGLVQHSCDGPDTNAQPTDGLTDSTTATGAPSPAPDGEGTLAPSGATIIGSALASFTVAGVLMLM